MGYREGMKASIAFFTIIPYGNRHFAREAIDFLWIPYIFLGTISAIGFYFLSMIMNIRFAALICFSIIPFLHGFQNVDALLDFGDGCMKRGIPEEKFAVMKKSDTGAGGIGLLFVVYSISVGSFLFMPKGNIFDSYIIMQVASSLWISLIMFRNRTFGNGFATYFSQETGKISFALISIVPPLLIVALLFPEYLLPLMITLPFAAVLRIFIRRNFGMINGDISGASGEIGRMFFLVVSGINILIVNIIPFRFNLLQFL